MRASLSVLAVALTFAGVQAAPFAEAADILAPIQARGGNDWWLGKNYKLRADCPDHKEVHNKFLNHRSDNTIGFEGQTDFKFQLEKGYWPDKSWGGHPVDVPSNKLCLQGNEGHKDITPVDNSVTKKWGGDGGLGGSPAAEGSYGKWWVDHMFPSKQEFDHYQSITDKHHLKYMWDDNSDLGWDWICYPDGNGGHKIKYWDHSYKLDIEIYFIIKIEIVKEENWGKAY